jgi:multicomponent Na+:H+ antiporter subunit D
MFAGRKYAAYTIGGASLGFMAVVLTTMFGASGTFIYGGSIDGTYDARMLLFAFVLGFIGFGAKAAVFPLHDWLPTASVAPTPVTALLHAVAVVNSGVFAVMRMTYYVFGADFLRGTIAQAICLVLAIFSLLFGAVQALRERHFKRRLAYSTMSNLSYMMLGAMTMSPLGLKAGLAHMVFHGIIKICLFMCAGAFMHRARKTYIYEINGIGRRMPYTFTAYTLCALSLTGIPLFCGFVSKWQLLQATLRAASEAAGNAVPDSRLSQILPYIFYAGTTALVIAAFLCAMYTLSISVRAFFPMDDKDWFREKKVKEAGPLMLVPIWIFAAVNLALGVCPGPILAVLTAIGEGRM